MAAVTAQKNATRTDMKFSRKAWSSISIERSRRRGYWTLVQQLSNNAHRRMGTESFLELSLPRRGVQLPAGGLARFQCLELQFVGDVVLVDVAHVADGLLSDPHGRDALDAVEPHVRVEPRPPRLGAQPRDAAGSCIVGGEREQRAEARR